MDITAISAAAVMFILGATSPGPSLAVILRNTMIGGRSRGLACAVGHGIGFGFYAVSVVFGLVVIMEKNPDVFTLMQIIGGLFLLYLGIGMIRSEETVIVQSEGKREGFFEGFFIAFLNPKIYRYFEGDANGTIQSRIRLKDNSLFTHPSLSPLLRRQGSTTYQIK